MRLPPTPKHMKLELPGANESLGCAKPCCTSYPSLVEQGLHKHYRASQWSLESFNASCLQAAKRASLNVARVYESTSSVLLPLLHHHHHHHHHRGGVPSTFNGNRRVPSYTAPSAFSGGGSCGSTVSATS
eukprot:3129688-Amphidinium_carterae.1